MAEEKKLMKVSPAAYKIFLEMARPELFVLYSAFWRHGYTVNGIRP